MKQIKNKTILNAILLFSIFALGSAYFIEHILKHEPCNLCLFERLPYIFAIIIILFNLFIKKYEKFFFILLSIIFISATFLSFYHFGIEQGFFIETKACNSTGDLNNLNKENVLKELENKIISCKDVTFRILGLSLASINTIISLILAVITIKVFLNYEKK
tara:strand:- start:120 stop:602 length:483 start_codon:yes stop_codon:yes gene_type:complete